MTNLDQRALKDAQELLERLSDIKAMACIADLVSGPGGFITGSQVQYNTAALSSSTAAVGYLTGAALCIAANSGATPGTLTTRTYAQMIADSNLSVGQSWLILLCNVVTTNAITLGAGSGVSVTGTATVAGFTARLFTATVTSASLITINGNLVSWTVAV